ERHRLAERRAGLLHLLLHSLVLADARVLVGDQTGVERDALEVFGDPVRSVERVGEALRRLRERTLERGERRNVLEDLVLRRAPGFVRRIQVREVPLVAVGDAGPIVLLRRGGDERGDEQREQRREHPAWPCTHGHRISPTTLRLPPSAESGQAESRQADCERTPETIVSTSCAAPPAATEPG